MSCNREHAAFVQHLFETYRDALLRHVRGLLGGRPDAEDIVQETCSRLLAAADLDRTEARARSYIFRIATNLAIDGHRRPREPSLEDVGEPATPVPGPEAIVDAAHTGIAGDGFVSVLPVESFYRIRDGRELHELHGPPAVQETATPIRSRTSPARGLARNG